MLNQQGKAVWRQHRYLARVLRDQEKGTRWSKPFAWFRDLLEFARGPRAVSYSTPCDKFCPDLSTLWLRQTYLLALTIPERYKLPLLLRKKVTPPMLACFGVVPAESFAPISCEQTNQGAPWSWFAPRIRTSLLPPSATWNLSPLIESSWRTLVGWPAREVRVFKCLSIFCFSRWSLSSAFCRRVSSIALLRAWVPLSYTKELMSCICRSRLVTQRFADCRDKGSSSSDGKIFVLGEAESGLRSFALRGKTPGVLFKTSVRFRWGLGAILPPRPRPRLYGATRSDLQGAAFEVFDEAWAYLFQGRDGAKPPFASCWAGVAWLLCRLMWPGCLSAKGLGCCGTSTHQLSCVSFLRVLDLPPTFRILDVSCVCLIDLRQTESVLDESVLMRVTKGLVLKLQGLLACGPAKTLVI